MGKDDGSLYFVSKDEDGTTVIRVSSGDAEGEVFKESEHKIKDGICDCKGFAYRNTCRHLEVATGEIVGTPLPLSDARAEVTRLMQELGKGFRYVGLPPEPYERDEDGNVTCATLDFRRASVKSKILKQGVWVGTLKGSGLKIKLLIG